MLWDFNAMLCYDVYCKRYALTDCNVPKMNSLFKNTTIYEKLKAYVTVIIKNALWKKGFWCWNEFLNSFKKRFIVC